jgi:hypothetical protein
MNKANFRVRSRYGRRAAGKSARTKLSFAPLSALLG